MNESLVLRKRRPRSWHRPVESKEIKEPSSILALFQRDPIETWQLMMVPIFGHDGEYTYPESADGCVSTPLSHKHTYIHDVCTMHS